MSQLTGEALDWALKQIQSAPKRYTYVVRMADILPLLRDLRKKGFTWQRGRTMEGKRNYMLTIWGNGSKLGTIYVNPFNTGEPGKIARIEENVFEPKLRWDRNLFR